MAFATDGTLFVTLPAFIKGGKMAPAHQIIQVDTNGKWTTLIDDAGGQKLNCPTNCAFGGPGPQNLDFTNLRGGHVSRCPTNLHGQPLYHQRLGPQVATATSS